MAKIRADLGAGDGCGDADFGIGDRPGGHIGGSDGTVINGTGGASGYRIENRQGAQPKVTACGGGRSGSRTAVFNGYRAGDVGGISCDVASYLRAGNVTGYLRGRNCPNNLCRRDIAGNLCRRNCPNDLRAAHGLDVIVGDCVSLPGAGDDATAGINGEGPAAAAGLRLLLINAAHGQGRVRIGGTDTDIAGLLIHHESRARFGLNVKQSLWILRADTDVAHRCEQVVPLLGGGPTVSRHEQVLAAVVLHFPVAVFYPHTEYEPPGNRQFFQHHALLAANTLVGGGHGKLNLDIVVPVFRVPLLHRVVIDHVGDRGGCIGAPAELHRHGYGVDGRGGLPVGSRVDFGYIHHSRRTFPHRCVKVAKPGVHGVLAAFFDLQRIGQVAFIDQVVLETNGVLSRLQAVKPVGAVIGCLSEITVLLGANHDTSKRQFILGGDGADDGAPFKRVQGGDVQRCCGGGRNCDQRWIVGVAVSRMHETHLVIADRDLADGERTVVVGEADVVGALDYDEGSRVAAGAPVVQDAVAGD